MMQKITFVVQIVYDSDEMVQVDYGEEGEAGEDPGMMNTEQEVERHWHARKFVMLTVSTPASLSSSKVWQKRGSAKTQHVMNGFPLISQAPKLSLAHHTCQWDRDAILGCYPSP